jgi:hypothetical protein
MSCMTLTRRVVSIGYHDSCNHMYRGALCCRSTDRCGLMSVCGYRVGVYQRCTIACYEVHMYLSLPCGSGVCTHSVGRSQL